MSDDRPMSPDAPDSSGEVLNVKHRRLEERLVALLEERGKHLSPHQGRLVKLFLATEGHHRLDDLLEALRSDYPEVTMAEVKATMGLIVDMGVARVLRTDAETFYEHQHLDDHHDHLVCIKCGTIAEFYDPTIEERQTLAAEKAGFRPMYHRLTIHGLCRKCFETTPYYRPLTTLKAGENAQIKWIEGGRGMASRLASLGLTRGCHVEVMQGSGAHASGPVTVSVRGARVALGHGMAMKIFVEVPKRESPS